MNEMNISKGRLQFCSRPFVPGSAGRNAGDSVPYGRNSIGRAERRGRRSLRSDFHTPGGTVNACSRHLDIKNVRIPYAERMLATGREILLDYRRAQPTSHEFGPRPCRVAGRNGQCPFPTFGYQKYSNSIRRADASDRSGNFTRLSSSTTYQARVWPPALPGGVAFGMGMW